MANELYTFQVILHWKDEAGNHIAHLFRDCNREQIAQYRREVWTIGIRVQNTPVCWEIISPYVIKQCFITLQDKAHGTQ